MAKLTTNDYVMLDYHIYGFGQPIILVAGYSGNQATWSGQIDQLVANGLQVITYDRRNHGDSDNVDYGMRLSRHGQDLAELIASLKLKKPILLGHSMGASTIWAYLSLYGDDNVLGIITEDQVPVMVKQKDWQFGLFQADCEHVTEAMSKLPGTKLTNIKLSEQMKRQISLHYKPFDFQYNAPLLFNSLLQDWRDVVAREKVPHLFIAGDKSPLWPAQHAVVTSQLATKGEYVIIKDAGHIPHIEAPDTFNQIVSNFIQKIISIKNAT